MSDDSSSIEDQPSVGPEEKKLQLHELIPKEWFDGQDLHSVWVRIYSTMMVSRDQLREFSAAKVQKISTSPPVRSVYGIIGGLELLLCTSDMYASEDGVTRIDLKTVTKTLPKSSYVMMMVPYRINGRPEAESGAIQHLNLVASVMAAHVGRNWMWTVVAEGELDAKKGGFSIPSGPIELPQIADGPALHPQNWIDTNEILCGIDKLSRQTADRVKLSLEFFYKSLREDERFFYWWTAMEILAEGKSAKILSKLKKCYGIEKQPLVEQETGFKVIRSWRHAYFHEGKRPLIMPDVNRFLQLLYLDLLRSELGLASRAHAMGMRSVDGYDLSPIGLLDRRTPEQKERQAMATTAMSSAPQVESNSS